MNEQQRIFGVFLGADTISGVFIIDPADYPELELMKPIDFYNELKDMGARITIFSFFDGNDEEIFNKIKKEYGIN